jgi:hypothetical protein
MRVEKFPEGLEFSALGRDLPRREKWNGVCDDLNI